MSCKIFHLCLVFVVICINHVPVVTQLQDGITFSQLIPVNQWDPVPRWDHVSVKIVFHETLSQVILDFKCTIEFPICQKPGVAREEQDIVTFSILLDMQDVNLDRWMWQYVAVVFDDNYVLESYNTKNWITYMYTTECTTTVPSFIEYKYRYPYKKCRQDLNNRRLLRMEIGVPASTHYNMSNIIAVWFNRARSYKKSKSVRYPMVLEKVEEKLRIDYKDMPGKNAYIRPGNYHVFQYCVIVKNTGRTLVYFKIGDKPHLVYSQVEKVDTRCPTYNVTTTRDDLYQIMTMKYFEIEGPCIMYINSTGRILDEAELYSSKSKANAQSTQSKELVLILVALSGAAMWMPST